MTSSKKDCTPWSKLARTRALLVFSLISFTRGPEIAYVVRDLCGMGLQCEVAGIKHMKFDVFQIPAVRFRARRQEHEVIPAPDDQGGRLERPEVLVPLRVALNVASVISVQDKLN